MKKMTHQYLTMNMKKMTKENYPCLPIRKKRGWLDLKLYITIKSKTNQQLPFNLTIVLIMSTFFYDEKKKNTHDHWLLSSRVLSEVKINK